MKAKTQSPRELGLEGEEIAKVYLKKKGFKILAEGFRTSRKEIDIIASQGDVIVFVEVKARRKSRFGFPEEAVDRAKQEKIKTAASAWLGRQPFKFRECRFDVISLIFSSEKDYEIRHLEDAF